eukprot:g2150.t1
MHLVESAAIQYSVLSVSTSSPPRDPWISTRFRLSWTLASKAQDWEEVVRDDGFGDWRELLGRDQERIKTVECYLKELSEKQQLAVKARSKVVRVIAGPGSGKTRVMIARAAKLIAHGVPPKNIMMLTFTNKAANEARKRLEDLFGNEQLDIRKLTNGTFHSICCRILRRHINRFDDGRSSRFRIIDDDEQQQIILDLLMAHCATPIDPMDSPETILMKKKSNQKLRREQRVKAKMYAEIISKIKDQTWPTYTKKVDGQGTLSWPKRNLRKDVAIILELYQQHLINENLCDFGDLVSNVVCLLKMFPSVKSELKSKFKHILVDEMQDTNFPQYEFIKLLIQKSNKGSDIDDNSLFAVGDPNQAIYGFRGARVENLDENMEKEFGYCMESIFLLDNYRSQAPVLRYAERILESFIVKPPYTEMNAIQKGGNLQHIQTIVSENEQSEALNVIKAIQELSGLGSYEYNKIAVLYRTHSLIKGLSFLQRTEIKDVLAYLRFAVNPNDSYAFERIGNKPTRGIGQKTIENLRVWTETTGSKFPGCLVADLENHWKTCTTSGAVIEVPELDFPKELTVTKPAKRGIQELREIYCKLRFAAAAADGESSVKGAIESLMNDCGYLEFLRKEYKHDLKRRLTAELYIKALMDATSFDPEEQENDLSNLEAFVQGVALNTSTDGSIGEAKNGVQLMTMHAAKGLEFPVVIIVGCEDQLIPMRLLNTPFEEETRLMFVAVTRAKEVLILSRALQRMHRGMLIENQMSPFLAVLESKLMNGRIKQLGSSKNGHLPNT